MLTVTVRLTLSITPVIFAPPPPRPLIVVLDVDPWYRVVIQMDNRRSMSSHPNKNTATCTDLIASGPILNVCATAERGEKVGPQRQSVLSRWENITALALALC